MTATTSSSRLPTGFAFYKRLLGSVLGAIVGTCAFLLYFLPLSAFRQLSAGKDATDARLKAKADSLRMLTDEAVEEVKGKCEQKYKDTIKSVQWELDISQHAIIGGNPDEATSLVVLLHGFPECWYTWHDVLPQLVNKGHFVVAPDMRGYGLSSAPLEVADYTTVKLAEDNRAIIRHVRKEIAPKIETVTIVGHDWGGAPTGEIALTEPDVVDRCVLVNIPHLKIFGSKLQMKHAPWQLFMSYYMLLIQIPGLFEYIHRGVALFSKFNKSYSSFGVKLMSASNALNVPAMLNYYRVLFLNFSLSPIFTSIWKYGPFASKAYASPPRKHVVSRVKSPAMRVPLLQLWGTNDKYVDVALAQLLEQNAEKYAPKGCEVVYIEGAGHFVAGEKPTEVASNIDRFIGSS